MLTGQQALSFGEVAALVSRIAGRSVRHESVGVDEIVARLAAAGVTC